jgi:peptide/nickel transport system substrate-binding protein
LNALRAMLAAGAVTLLVLVAGCGGSASNARSTWQDPNPLPPDTMQYGHGEVGQHGGRMVVAQTNDPRSFNVMMTNEQSSADVNNLIWGSLFGYDYVNDRMQPELAKSWEMSADSLSYTVHLRRGIRFSDGTPITAADVLFSAEVALDETLHPVVYDGLHFQDLPFRFEAPDSLTIVIRTPKPIAQALWSVSSMRILPRHRLESVYRAGQFASAYNVSTAPESLVTSGAWRLKQFVPGEKTVVERNPWWFRVDARGQRLPYLDELVFLIVPDQNTAALKFQSGEVDAVDNVKPEDYKAYVDQQQQGDFTLHTVGPSLSTNFLWFNLNTVKEAKKGKRPGDPEVGAVKYAWFRNPAFRKAVSKAIDRDAMIRGPYFGEAVKNWSTTTPGNKRWHSKDFSGDDYDPAGARELLGSIGMKDRNGDGVIEDEQGRPIRFSIKTNAENDVRKALTNMVKEDLAKVGIEVSSNPTQFNALMTNLRQDFDYDAILLGLGSGIPPDPSLSVNVFRSSGLTHFWNIKQTKPETPEEARVDQLTEVVAGSFDEAERHRAYAEIVRILNGENWFIWLPSQVIRLPVRNRLGNATPQVVPNRVIWNAERVFVKRPSKAT